MQGLLLLSHINKRFKS